MIKIYELENMSQEKCDFLIKRSQFDIECVKDKVKAIIEDVSINGDMFAHHDYVSKMLLSSIGTVSFNRSVRVWKIISAGT